MSRDYGNNPDEGFNYQPYVAASNVNATPVDSQGERYATIIDFDVSSADVYSKIKDEVLYQTAWDTYFDEENGIPQTYTPENALKLREAVKFYLYFNDDEIVNYDPTYPSDGVWSEGEKVRQNSVGITRMAPFENPAVFHDYDQYVSSIGGDVDNPQPIPLIVPDGTKGAVVTADKPWMAEVVTSEYLTLNEWESTKRSPKTEYEFGGAYSVGKNSPSY